MLAQFNWTVFKVKVKEIEELHEAKREKKTNVDKDIEFVVKSLTTRQKAILREIIAILEKTRTEEIYY